MRHDHLHQRLLDRRTQLFARYLDELERANQAIAEHEPEAVDAATDQADARLLATLGDADRQALAAVIAALRRIEAGSYGRCVECTAPIGQGRLEAVPETPTCIHCASAARHA